MYSVNLTPLYTMPVPPIQDHPDYTYYQAFVHAMNRLPKNLNISLKLRKAIEQSADHTITSPAHIARLLVDYGLRAPRASFPKSFLDFIDQCPQQNAENGYDRMARSAIDSDVIELKDFWTSLNHLVGKELVPENA
jgi:hypothetical protein